jgi:hypothetical protein
LEALSSLESLLESAFAVAALALALASARHALRERQATPRTGELAWSAVALAVLVGVSLAVRLGGSHGF